MRRKHRVAAAFVGGALAAGAVAYGVRSNQSSYPMPITKFTPGALNPAVTQADINSTICVKGWTATIRPPASFTDSLKVQQIAQYGYKDTKPQDYEEDHRVPLEAGGAPHDPKNLWPEPWTDARTKDRLENQVRADICSGKLSLAAGQKVFLGDWHTAKIP